MLIDDANLNTYDGSIPTSIIESATTFNDHLRQDAQSEEGGTAARLFSTDPVTDVSQMQSSFLYEDESESLPLKDIYTSVHSNIIPSIKLASAPLSSINSSVAMVSGNTLVNSSDPSFYAWSFPVLFPYGSGTPNCARQTPISLKQYVKQALSVHESLFRTNHPFMFTVFDSLRHLEILFSVKLHVQRVASVQLKSLNDITEADIKEAIILKNSNSIIPENHPAKPLMSAIRLVGARTKYSDYFKSNSRSEIMSTIISSGPPALYVTISPLDHRHILAFKFTNKTLDLDSSNLPESLNDDQFRLRQAAQNPVSLAEFFHVLISQILNTLIGGGRNNVGIFGPLQHYYGMVEAQNRGTLHIHLVLWIHGTPNADTLFRKLNSGADFQLKLFDYLDRIVKTDQSEYPLQEDNPSLSGRASMQPLLSPLEMTCPSTLSARMHGAVSEYQTHHHTSSCFKNAKNNTICRHRMPCKCHESTQFDASTGEIVQRRSDPLVNKFNPFLTSIANSNTDVSYLFRTQSSLAVMYYITMYITKSDDQVHNYFALIGATKQALLDKPMVSSITDLRPEQMELRAFLLRMFNQIYKATQRPSNIVSTLLLDLPMSYKSGK